MYKKSQAALEFLTTYGWAFLIIIIMIGALAYFGILSPSKLLPSRCNFGSEFQCLDHQIDATGSRIRFRLKNNLGEPITISSINFGSEGSTSFSCAAIPEVPASLPIAWPSGNVTDFRFGTCNPGPAGMVAGEKGKVSVTITYNTVSSGATYAKTVKGEIYSTVQ